MDWLRCDVAAGKNRKTPAKYPERLISDNQILEPASGKRSYNGNDTVFLLGYSLAVQKEKQTVEILRRRPSADNQRHRQQGQTQAGPPAIALGRQQNIEKRRIRRCRQRDKSKE